MVTTNSKPLIKFDKITKKFGGITALTGLSFDIYKGEFVYLTGHSGAGKTTALKLITREITPEEGNILIEGVNIGQLPASQVPHLRQKIGMVFQDYKLIPERTVRENIEVALAVGGIPSEEWKERESGVLKLVGLSERGGLFPSQLSGGEMQRVAMARAIVVNPKLILADEPTGNLDWETSEAIMNVFVKINKEGKTVLIATHNRMLVEKIPGRVITMEHGRVIKDSGAK